MDIVPVAMVSSGLRVLGVICARAGSKSLPNKNLALINGNPLIWYSIWAAQKSKLLSRCVVSTDSSEIADVAKQAGAEVPFLRPASMATDTCRIELAVKHALEFVEHEEHRRYDLVVLLQNSSPLRSSEDIDWCINLMAGHMHDADSVASACLINHEHPLKIKQLSADGYFEPFWKDTDIYRRQDLPHLYVLNGAVYVVRRDYLVEYGSVVGEQCMPYIMEKWRSVDVHDEMDLKIAEALMK